MFTQNLRRSPVSLDSYGLLEVEVGSGVEKARIRVNLSTEEVQKLQQQCTRYLEHQKRLEIVLRRSANMYNKFASENKAD